MRPWPALLLLLAPPVAAQGRVETEPAALSATIEALGGSYEESTAATAALEQLGAEAVPAVVARLATAGDDLRWGLVNLLGILRDPHALEPLVRVAVEHGEVHARWRAYWAIAAVDDGRAAKLLEPYLEHPDAEVRWRAVAGLAFLEHPSAVPHLEAGLAAPEEWRRWEAVNGLAAVAGPESWRRVAALATGDREATVRQEAVMTLWKLGDARALPALLDAADDASPHVRWRALAAVAEIAPERGDWVRERAAADPSEVVRGTFDR